MACLIAASHWKIAVYAVAAFYFLGGIVASSMIPAPLWFILLDLGAAYIPMAWLALKLGEIVSGRKRGRATS